jgi:hypothetical protein
MATVRLVRSTGADVVILQDGSAPMRVRDVAGDRWQRSIQFLRTIGESLRWKNDRIALALFAHVAEPQVRLTKDPNTYFFFLDHLEDTSPFRLEDDGTWDTNTERGIYWGLRLIEKDEEIRRNSPAQKAAPENDNARAFILISDGQSWSGEVAKSLALAQEKSVPLNAIGVVVQSVDRAAEIAETVSAAARLAFSTGRAVAVLISQRVIGAKQFK